eukprot:87277-Pyramimonas_sp.AAC.1
MPQRPPQEAPGGLPGPRTELVKILNIWCRCVYLFLLLCLPHFGGPRRPRASYPPTGGCDA